MNPIHFITHRLVKTEDLNHHGTLFAGRGAEWLIESGFIAVASLLNAKNIICAKVHGIQFTSPVKPGEILRFDSAVVNTGRTSLTSYIGVMRKGEDKAIVEGYITFVHVDEHTKPQPHGITVEPLTENEKQQQEVAKNLPR